MIVFPNNRAFIHIPKTGGSSVITALGLMNAKRMVYIDGVYTYSTNEMIRYDDTRGHGGHMLPSECSELGIPKPTYTFTLIRNPYRLVVSQYLQSLFSHNSILCAGEPYIMDVNIPFDEFVRKRLCVKFHHHFWSGYTVYTDQCDKVYKLEDGIQAMFDAEGIEAKEKGRANTRTYQKTWCDYYTDETKAIVAEVFKKEIEEFNYDFS